MTEYEYDTEDEDGDIAVKYLKRCPKQPEKFVFNGEEASFPVSDVKAILPMPDWQGTTARTKGFFSFKNVAFGNIKPSHSR